MVSFILPELGFKIANDSQKGVGTLWIEVKDMQ
jgi:hypothetical protein